MTDKLKPGRRYRFTGEGVADDDGYIRLEDVEEALFWIGPENMSDITFELIPDPAPTEPGSVVTVKLLFDHPPFERLEQAIKMNDHWRWMSNGTRLADIEDFEIVSDTESAFDTGPIYLLGCNTSRSG